MANKKKTEEINETKIVEVQGDEKNLKITQKIDLKQFI